MGNLKRNILISVLFFASMVMANAASFFQKSALITQNTVDTADNSTTTLIATSNQVHIATGNNTKVYSLPDATTMIQGTWLEFIDDADDVLVVNDDNGANILTLRPTQRGKLWLSSNASNGGVWRKSVLTPEGSIYHNQLLGLSQDDHPQYLTAARGDSRYYQKSEFINSFTGLSGEPVKTAAGGQISPSLIPSSAGGIGGPGVAVTDNSIVRWDGTSGNNIQGSGVTIDDSGNIVAPFNVSAQNLNLSGSLYAVGTIEATSDIISRQNVLATGNITAGGSLSGASLSVSGTGSVTGPLAVTNNINVNGDVIARGHVYATDDIISRKDVLATGNITTGGNFSATGNSTIGGSETVIGTITFGRGVDNQNLNMAGSLYAVGGIYATDNIITRRNVLATGSVVALGDILATGNMNTLGTFGATGTATFTGELRSPGTGSNSWKAGNSAVAQGPSTIALGISATAYDGQDNIAIGKSANAGANGDSSKIRCISIGTSANCSVLTRGIAIGDNTVVSASNGIIIGGNSSDGGTNAIGIGTSQSLNNTAAIGLGTSVTSTGNNQFIVGSETAPINTIYFGEGTSSTTPSALTLQTSDGSGSDIAAGDITITPGRSTGAAPPANIIFRTSRANGTGSGAQTMQDRMRIATDSVQIAKLPTPATPGGQFGAVYFDATDNVPTFKNNAGTVYKVTASSGGGGSIAAWASDSSNFTFTGFGTVTNKTIWSRCVGGELEVRGSFQGGATSGSVSIDISTYTIKTSVLSSASMGQTMGFLFDGSASYSGNISWNNGIYNIWYDGSTSTNLYLISSKQSDPPTKIDAAPFGTNDKYEVHFTFPTTSCE